MDGSKEKILQQRIDDTNVVALSDHEEQMLLEEAKMKKINDISKEVKQYKSYEEIDPEAEEESRKADKARREKEKADKKEAEAEAWIKSE